MLLSTAFCPPIEYFALLARYSVVYLEACENYQKQSWRNRCRILSANGPLDLSYPLVHGEGTGRLITELKIEYTTPWVPKMEKAIESAYFSSPFFEFYRDGLFALLESGAESLWDMNLQIILWLCAKFGIAPEIRRTEDYQREAEDDYREAIHPKRENSILADLGLERPYWQVFGQKFGFTPGLSALDLLFCQGPDSILWLKDLGFEIRK